MVHHAPNTRERTMPTDLITQAHRILATPAGQLIGCSWVADRQQWLDAAQSALDGDDYDLAYFLDQEAAELWLWPEWESDQWKANYRAAESYVPGLAA